MHEHTDAQRAQTQRLRNARSAHSTLQYLSELLDAALVLDDAAGVLGILGAQGVILAPVALEAALQERVPVVVELVLRLRLGELHAQIGGGVGRVQELRRGEVRAERA